MAINLGGVVYLTMAEVTEILGVHKTLGHAYLKKGEFPNAVNMDCQVVLKDALAESGLNVSDKNLKTLFSSDKCSHYLVPLSDVINKVNRRLEAKSNRTGSVAKNKLARMEAKMNKLRENSRIAEEKMERLRKSIEQNESVLGVSKSVANGEVETATA